MTARQASLAQTIRLVSPVEAVRDWPRYERQILRVIETMDLPQWPDDVLTCIQQGTMQLWRTVNGDGIGVTELQTFPRYKQLLLYIVAGDNAQDWLTGADQQLEDFAQSHGCKYMAFHGRPGWSKWCAAFGYKHTAVRMAKEVRHGRRQQSAADL
jgi:hypothetical protein